MKIFGICSLILASICCFFVLFGFIGAWFKRNKEDFYTGLLSFVFYAIWIITASFLVAAC